MLIKEYRILLPISVKEYQVGQLYAVAEASKNETSGKEGVEVLENKPYEKNGRSGQYTHKIYHLGSRVPAWLLPLLPKDCLKLHEEAWNEYPYCKTVLTRCSPIRMVEPCDLRFIGNRYKNEYVKSLKIEIETRHEGDMGDEINVHELDPEKLQQREVVYIDIAADEQSSKGSKASEVTPSTFKSVKTGRGPLGPDWKEKLFNNPDCPHMCAYKLVTVECKINLLQGKVESFIHKFEKDLFTKFHKQLFCWIDDWIDLSLEDIRALEEDTKKELEQKLEKEETGKKGK